MKFLSSHTIIILFVFSFTNYAIAQVGHQNKEIDRIVLSNVDNIFVDSNGEEFFIWGLNYTIGNHIKLIEDKWLEDSTWIIINEDFEEMKNYTANIVRVHLQYNKFMLDTKTPDPIALEGLDKLIKIAENNEIYLLITGLAAYRKSDSPDWYDDLSDSLRWETHNVFWKSVAETVQQRNIVFAYDLINEPVVNVECKDDPDCWLPGKELSGWQFVQNIARNSSDGYGGTILKWTEKLVKTIRSVDTMTFITTGFLNIGNIDVLSKNMDLISAHIYPKTNKIDEAISKVKNSISDKPYILEEFYSTFVPEDQLCAFLEGIEGHYNGLISHYFGRTLEEYEMDTGLVAAIHKFNLEFFIKKNPNTSYPTNYYVDESDGSDTNSGTSPKTPWKSISKVNSSLFLPGDSILFKRNEIWREQLVVPSSGQKDNPITFGAYGQGDKPLFLGSVAQNNATDWTNLGSNQWATAIGAFPKIRWRSVGFILMGEELQENVGTWVKTKAELNEEGEFWWEEKNQRVVLYSPKGNPATVYGTVEVAHKHSCFLPKYKDYLVIQDLAFKYTNNSAIIPEACNNILIQRIEASYLGGGYGTTTRAGDAIPPHGKSSNITIRDCIISQIFDTGIAPQLYPNDEVEMHDIIIENCTIDRAGSGISVGAHGAIASEIYNIYIRNNIITNSGYGWSGINNNEKGKAISIKEKHGDIKPDVHDINIENNVIDTYSFRGINAYEGNFNITGNIIKNGRTDYIEGTLGFPGAIALTGGDFSKKSSTGEATGIVSYNLIYDNKCPGILIKHNTPYPSDPLEIYNNVLYNNGDSTYSNIKSITSSGTIIKNNIIYSEFQNFVELDHFGDGTTDLTNNLYHSSSQAVWNWDGTEYSDLGSYQKASGLDSFSIFEDPEFIDLDNYNFHVHQSSPVIDAGVDVGLNEDYEGIFVPLGLAPDIGAYEFDVVNRINDSKNKLLNRNIKARLSIYPNPSNGNCKIQIKNCSSLIDEGDELRIYNIQGTLIDKLNMNNNVSIWNNNLVQSGIYLIKFEGKTISLSQKLLLVR